MATGVTYIIYGSLLVAVYLLGGADIGEWGFEALLELIGFLPDPFQLP